MPAPRRLILLGSTGSIGRQTVEVVNALNAIPGAPRFTIVGLAAGRNADALLDQARSLGVRDLALTSAEGAQTPGMRTGPDAAERLVREVEADIVLSAIVGAAGLPATLAAVELGRDIALANKETLVAAGSLVVPAARDSGSRLLPVDSEHSAVWQCLCSHPPAPAADLPCCPPMDVGPEVRLVTLTASGGPFRSLPAGAVFNATPEQALNHPTWKMGAKVTIDSASLMNKGLELIEAHWLFSLGNDRLAAIIHPQSLIHAFVEYADGSTLAQIGAPDMRTPIQCALTFPARAPGISRRLDLAALSRLDFEPIDDERFPAVRLARRVIDLTDHAGRGSTAGAVLNAANEAAVEAFLDHRIPFGAIPQLVEAALSPSAGVGASPIRDLGDILAADGEARRFVRSRLESPRPVARPAGAARV